MMPVIKTQVDPRTYTKLVAMRKRAGVPSVSALFLKETVGLTDEMEANEIVKQAMSAADRRVTGDTFRLRDLFVDHRWNGFSKGARLRAGRAFFAKVAVARDGIRIGKKSASNHQLYVKS